MSALFLCLLTLTCTEWCFTGQLSQRFLGLLCRHWLHCLARGLTGENIWTCIKLYKCYRGHFNLASLCFYAFFLEKNITTLLSTLYILVVCTEKY